MNRKLLIDTDIFVYNIASSCQEKVLFGELLTLQVNTSEMKKKFKSKMSWLVKHLGHPIGYFLISGPTAKNFRKGILPTYKENRKAVERPIGHAWLLDWIRKEYSDRVREVEHLEADDLMGILSTKCPGEFIIVSEDKDMQTVPGGWYNPRQEEVMEVSEEHANHFHMFQTLAGDTADNYKGLLGVGKVNAERILEKCKSPQERWEAVVEAYTKAGYTEEDALVQARCAFILHSDYYNMKTKEVKLWMPKMTKDE